jgi:glycosyltransferase involved in cell wall biosynthesis
MPLSFLEAMGAGLPIVAPHVAGIPEIVDAGAQGLLFPPGRLEDLVHAIRRLAADDALRQQLGQAAAEKAQAHFSIETMVHGYENVYDEMLRGR